MTIKLFQDKEMKGRSMQISRNFRSLKTTTLGNHPSSLTMSSNDDAVLLFDKEDWHGGVMYFRGKRNMTSLGKTSQGGEWFSANSVTSVRVTPFTLKLNVNVITTGDGRFPGGAPGETRDAGRMQYPVKSQSIESSIGKAALLANFFYERTDAMLKLEVTRFNYIPNDGKFDLKKSETADFPADWKRKGEIDVIVCNTLQKAHGMAKFPWWGKVVILEMDDRSINEIARTLAHEIGHYLGLTHGSGGGGAKNLMTASDLACPIDETTLASEQIEEMHQKLARNLTRKGDRHG